MNLKKVSDGLHKLNTSQIIALGFAGVIFVGGLILWLPFCSAPGQAVTFPDAVFTAATSVCVTGLSTVVMAVQWSPIGKAVILCLIQIGGIGLIALANMIFISLRRKISLKNRRIIKESYNLDEMGGVVSVVRSVVKCVFLAEGIGALLYAFCFVPEFGIKKGLVHAIFLAVSAFCNAGIDLMGIRIPFSSLTLYAANPLVNLVIMALIIIGGIGFLTWDDICENKWQFHRYRMQSKVILVTTCLLIVLPATFFFFADFSALPAGNRLLVSFFQSITPRTAGFNTVNLSAMSSASQGVIILLMLIGGSPGSTAGGMKTTTLAVLLANAAATFRQRDSAQFFGRRVDCGAVKTAATILTMYLALFFGGGVFISVFENLPLPV